MRKQSYWFKVTFGKWNNEEFDSEHSFLYVSAWSAYHAATKAERQCENGEIIISIQFLGYPQI